MEDYEAHKTSFSGPNSDWKSFGKRTNSSGISTRRIKKYAPRQLGESWQSESKASWNASSLTMSMTPVFWLGFPFPFSWPRCGRRRLGIVKDLLAVIRDGFLGL